MFSTNLLPNTSKCVKKMKKIRGFLEVFCIVGFFLPAMRAADSSASLRLKISCNKMIYVYNISFSLSFSLNLFSLSLGGGLGNLRMVITGHFQPSYFYLEGLVIGYNSRFSRLGWGCRFESHRYTFKNHFHNNLSNTETLSFSRFLSFFFLRSILFLNFSLIHNFFTFLSLLFYFSPYLFPFGFRRIRGRAETCFVDALLYVYKQQDATKKVFLCSY